MALTVTVKWGKQKFEKVELDTAAPVELFKAQLYALTQVPPDRQKIMGVKGGTVKDDANWADLGVKQGQTLMLMGSAEKLADPPPEATVFAEDMPAENLAAAMTTNPAGIANLGNTCYLNSTLQCMRKVPELQTSLAAYLTNDGPDPMVVGMRDMMGELERGNASKEVVPIKFVNTFRTAFPMFAERTDDGRGYVQQDAEECWSTIINSLSQKIKVATDASPSNLGASQPLLKGMEALRDNMGDSLFGVETETVYTCAETDAEPPKTQRESLRKISCHISDKTAHLYSALEESLAETIEKASALLGREATYKKASRLARLPPYLAVNFVRFAWRKDTNKRAKILRTVSFPEVLDVRNLCTEPLQKTINAHCELLRKEEDAAMGLAPVKPEAAPSSADASSAEPMETDAPAEPSDDELRALAAGAAGTGNDCKTGRYELFGIITHQGRTAEGGHYVAWVKKDAKKWLVFDDETVAEVDAERIKELHGGGDWHIAYMCLFRKMETTSLEPPKAKKKAADAPVAIS